MVLVLIYTAYLKKNSSIQLNGPVHVCEHQRAQLNVEKIEGKIFNDVPSDKKRDIKVKHLDLFGSVKDKWFHKIMVCNVHVVFICSMKESR